MYMTNNDPGYFDPFLQIYKEADPIEVINPKRSEQPRNLYKFGAPFGPGLYT